MLLIFKIDLNGSLLYSKFLMNYHYKYMFNLLMILIFISSKLCQVIDKWKVFFKKTSFIHSVIVSMYTTNVNK